MKSRNRPTFLQIMALVMVAVVAWFRRKKPVPTWAEPSPVPKKSWDPKLAPAPPIAHPHPLLGKPAPYGADQSFGDMIAGSEILQAADPDRVVVETITERDGFDGSQSMAAGEAAVEDGWIEAGGPVCPAAFPIKGNASSLIYHLPGQSSYEATVPEICFATEKAAAQLGYRPRKR